MTGISELIRAAQAASVSPEGDSGKAGREADRKIRRENVAQDLPSLRRREQEGRVDGTRAKEMNGEEEKRVESAGEDVALDSLICYKSLSCNENQRVHVCVVRRRVTESRFTSRL